VVKVGGLDMTSYVTPATRRRVVLVYELWHEDERVTLGVVPFIPTKHLALETPGLTATVAETAGGFAITVATENLARFVWLMLESADPALNTDVVFSDNYFDLPADRSVTVTIPAGEGWTLEKVQAALRVRSLVDSY
jgi:beta-mannosidase